MENAIKEDNVKAEQSVVHSSQSVFGKTPPSSGQWSRKQESESV